MIGPNIPTKFIVPGNDFRCSQSEFSGHKWHDVYDMPCDITILAMQYKWNTKALFNAKLQAF